MADTEHIAGLLGETEPSVSPDNRRPLSISWITDDLLQSTIDIWSPRYGRTLSTEEAIEILINVKRFGETLLKSSNKRRNEL